MTLTRKFLMLTVVFTFMFFGFVVQAQVQSQSLQKKMQNQEKQQISDSTLQQFAGALKVVQAMNKDVQKEMGETVTEAGMEVERYQEIALASQNPDAEVDMTAEEQQKVKQINQDLQQLQMKVQTEMQSEITKQGLTVERYQELVTIIQSDPALMQRFQQIMQN